MKALTGPSLLRVGRHASMRCTVAGVVGILAAIGGGNAAEGREFFVSVPGIPGPYCAEKRLMEIGGVELAATIGVAAIVTRGQSQAQRDWHRCREIVGAAPTKIRLLRARLRLRPRKSTAGSRSCERPERRPGFAG